jgi:hypothetical protein
MMPCNFGQRDVVQIPWLYHKALFPNPQAKKVEKEVTNQNQLGYQSVFSLCSK